MNFFLQGSKNRLENQLSAKGQHKKLCVVWRKKAGGGRLPCRSASNRLNEIPPEPVKGKQPETVSHAQITWPLLENHLPMQKGLPLQTAPFMAKTILRHHPSGGPPLPGGQPLFPPAHALAKRLSCTSKALLPGWIPRLRLPPDESPACTVQAHSPG